MAVTLASVDGTFSGSAANPIYYDAGELRRADAAMFAAAGISSGLSVSVDGSDVVTVTAGSAVISGEDAVSGTGVYRAGIAAAASGSLEARDATNGRIDLVVFRQYDTDVVASHPRRASEIEIITGTPSATPGVPTKPSMAVELARITVPKSGGAAASVDSSHRVYAVAVGASIANAGAGGNLGTGLAAFAAVTIPAGTWTLIGKAFLDWSIASLGEFASFDLWNGGAQIDVAKATYPVLTGYQSVSLLGSVTVTTATTIQLRAQTSGLDGTQLISYPQLVAIPG